MIDRIAELYEMLDGITKVKNSPFKSATTTEGRLYELRMGLFAAQKSGDADRVRILSELTDRVEEYKRLCIGLVREKAETLDFDMTEFTHMVLYLGDIAEDNTTEKELLLDEFGRIYQKYASSDGRDATDEAIMLSLLIDAYGKDTYYWRARRYVARLEELLKNELSGQDVSEYNGLLCERYESLYQFYRRVRDVRRAAMALRGAAERAYGAKDIARSAYYLQRALSCELGLPRSLRPEIDEAEIREAYGEHADGVLTLGDGPHLAVDPVEHTEKFLSLYDDVMEAVQMELPFNSRGYPPHLTWSLIAAEYRKRGIDWRDPGQMNPRVMFD